AISLFERLLVRAYSLVVQFSKINHSCPTCSLSKAGTSIYHSYFSFATCFFQVTFVFPHVSAATFIR
ncbi:hypothetical protein, partial [Paenibacillus pectinilyticus]|uniref:hypothetical protein n=1 Tax=Paenibacillus pectinilyticus TaxID=512399 RepID=UPI001ABFF340